MIDAPIKEGHPMNNKIPTDKFIKAAADLSGRDPLELDAREALHILQEYGRRPVSTVVYHQLIDDAAKVLFSDPQRVEEWAALEKEWDGKAPNLLALTVQRELSPIIREKAQEIYNGLPQDDPRRQELENILTTTTISPEMQETLTSIAETVRPIIDGVQAAARAAVIMNETIQTAIKPLSDLFPAFTELRESMAKLRANNPIFMLFDEITGDLAPYIDEELKNPQYNGKTIDELWEDAEENDNGLFSENSQLMQAVKAAREAKAREDIIAAQNAGRALRRQIKENAERKGAIMELRNDGALPVFSQKDLWDAFAPGRISKIGTLAPDMINKKTGQIEKISLEQGDILPLNATEISYKAFLLLNAILANSVENFREYFISNGSITFYVKGVLDRLDVDPRVRNNMQLDFDRKTAGVLYLEKQFEPLLSFIGTTPDGSRYSVFSYDGYNVESDTMTIRTPYLYQLWKITQTTFAERKKDKEQRIANGKKPLKNDLKPLEINTLFKGTAYKEDDAVLEIATYITNVLLNAGKGAHKTEISFRTLIKNCPRLQEKLDEIGRRPNTEKLPDGKKRNNTARYNVELRKIARAYSLIMTQEKCDALKYFEFIEFTPTKENDGKLEFIPPTKSTLDGKITIKFRRITPETE